MFKTQGLGMLSRVHFDKDVGMDGDIMDAVSGVRKANRTIPTKVVPWQGPKASATKPSTLKCPRRRV